MNRRELRELEADRVKAQLILGLDYAPAGDGQDAAILIEAFHRGMPEADRIEAAFPLDHWLRVQCDRCPEGTRDRWSWLRCRPIGKSARLVARETATRLAALEWWPNAPAHSRAMASLVIALCRLQTTAAGKLAMWHVCQRAMPSGEWSRVESVAPLEWNPEEYQRRLVDLTMRVMRGERPHDEAIFQPPLSPLGSIRIRPFGARDWVWMNIIQGDDQ